MDGPNSVCRDEFEVFNSNGDNGRIPTICGYNTGEHSKMFHFFYSSQHTVKSRAVDRSTIQFWNLLAKGHST